MPGIKLSPQEISRRGQEIYERDLRAQLETEKNIGKVLVIDIETGAYEMDEDHLSAIHRAKARRPAAILYGMRIGYSSLYKVGGAWGRVDPS